jgi:Domain of unknown function (DUF1707)
VCHRRSHFADEAWSRRGSAPRVADADRDLRASDADRDRIAAQLREHAGAGRLSVDELAERLDVVFAARTLGELEPPLADLPRAERDPRHHRSPIVATPLLALAVLLVMAWALTGAGAFWPVWVLLGLWWFGPLGRRHRWARGRHSVL